jgi:hypothetical protein
MKLISRLDIANTLHLTLEDGTTPPSILRGSVVLLREHQLDLVSYFGNVLVPPDSEAGKRALVEVAFEREKAAKIAALLKNMGCKSVREARNRNVPAWEAECPTATGFITEREKADKDLVALLQLIRSAPPPPAKPSFLKELFKVKK